MKKIILLASILFSINAVAQLPPYVPTNGLVAAYLFDGNALDQSGNGNDGSIIGPTLVTGHFSNCNQNSAYDFDGINDSIVVANSSSFDFSNNEQTISFWVKINTLPASNIFNIILHKLSGGVNQYNGFQVYIDNDPGTDNGIQYRFSNGNSTWGYAKILANSLPLNQWMFIAFTTDGINVKAYLNGSLVNTTNVPSTNIGNNSSPLIFSSKYWHTSSIQYFSGELDETYIYDRALNSTEINQLYSGCQYLYDTVTVAVYDTITVYDSISVTDTLIINAILTGVNPPNNVNTIKVFPNPANTHIYIDNGNFNLMSGYTVKVTNSLSQTVFQSAINQQQFFVDLSGWSGLGIYFVHIIDPQNNTIDIRKIILQ